jgi:hypothetical protein
MFTVVRNRNLFLQFARQPIVIGIKISNVSRTRLPQASIPSGSCALIGRMLDERNARIGLCNLTRYPVSPIAATVINHY